MGEEAEEVIYRPGKRGRKGGVGQTLPSMKTIQEVKMERHVWDRESS